MRTISGSPKRRATEAVRRFDQRHELAKRRFRAVVGNGANQTTTSRNLYYWVRLLGRQEMLAQARCEIFIPSYGQHVIVEESTHSGQRFYIIVGRPDDQGWFSEAGSLVGPHHESHEVGGDDMVTVGKYLLESLRALPSSPVSMRVFVTYDDSLGFGQSIVSFPSVAGESGAYSEDFVPPVIGLYWALLSVDEDAELTITYGEADMVTPVRPECPAGHIPTCWVLLSPGQASITAAHIYDARPLFSIGIEGDTGPTGPDGVSSEDAGHIHVFHEDKTAECDAAKVAFLTAQEFEPGSVMVFADGLLLRQSDYDESAALDEIVLDVAPIADTELLLFYLAAQEMEGSLQEPGGLALTATITSAPQTVSIEQLTPTGGAATIYWGDDTSEAIPENSTAELTHIYTINGVYAINVISVGTITYLDLRDSKIGCVVGTIGELTELITLRLYNSSRLTVGAGEIDLLTSLTSLTLISCANITIGAGEIELLTSLTTLHLSIMVNVTVGSGEIGLLTSLTTLYLYNVASVTPAAADFALLLAVQSIVFQNGLNAAAVDAMLQAMYGAKANYTHATPTLNIAVLNATPGGVYQAQCPPTTGLEWVYELANDSCAVGGPEWAITYEGGSAP